MPTTPKLGLRYPSASDAPDGPGAFFNLATDVENTLGGGSWAPRLGGSGATMGGNAGSDGTFFASGKHVTAKGRIVFGSSASFGGGVATVTSLPNTIDVSHSTGYGFYLPTSGNPVPVFFVGVDGANLAIRPVQGSGAGSPTTLGLGFNLGTPPQSSQMIFTLDLTLA